MTISIHEDSQKAYDIVKKLQNLFVTKLNKISILNDNKEASEIKWLRNKGLNGGGNRFVFKDCSFFNTASINVSHIQYENDENKKLQSVSALSTIIHPNNPKNPSIHMHISYSKLKDEKASFRIMADLNPSIFKDKNEELFTKALKVLAKDTFDEGKTQGDKYFYIPALKTHRGCSHFYLENYFTNDLEKDFDFAYKFGEEIINTYISMLLVHNKSTNKDDLQKQLDYHTLYFYQVLCLDAGTVSGLLVHNENDLGILASLPTKINIKLLDSWLILQKNTQDILLENICECIKEDGIINDDIKIKIANIIREFYKKYPEAVSFLASSFKKTSVISNHK